MNVEDGSLYDITNVRIPENLRGLLDFMLQNNKMVAIDSYDPKLLSIWSDDVLSKIKSGSISWEEDVPEEVVKAIKFFELFGYQSKVIS
jgi:hypothetical protein